MADRNGIVARTVAALRYVATGTTPDGWFGPGTALPDQAPPEVKGRTFDYPFFVNVDYIPRSKEKIGFAKLKALATNCEPLKLVMARQRDLVKALEWNIKPRQVPGAKPVKSNKVDPAIIAIETFLERPDQHHDWAQWIGAILDQLFVYDAVSIYARPTRGGDLYALEQVDGATITPLVDAWGRRPMAPDAAFKQVIKGLPAVHYTIEELIYYPENFRVDHIYGCSRVEQIITTVETSIARMRSQLGYFTHGNIGDGYFTAPQGYNPDQVALVEKAWNALMSADGGARIADRRQVPFLPNGFDWHATKADLFQAEFDEWLIRLICFCFGTPPTPFIKEGGLGKAIADADKETSEEGGIAQLMQYVRRLMNRILAVEFNRPDLEFSWVEDREMDPMVAAQIDDKRLRNGSLTINEVRDRNGGDPIPDGDTPLIYTASGAVPLTDVVTPSETTPPVNPAGGAGPDAEDATNGGKAGADGGADPMAKAAGNEAKLAKLIGDYLAARGAEIATHLGDALGLQKVDPMDDYSGRIDDAFDEVDWDWRDLAPKATPIFTGIAVPAGKEALSELGLFDKATIAKMTARATAWAEQRAAELVGMKLVDGELVENPDAIWSISAATRNMLRGTITEAMEAGASNDELAKSIRDSDAFSRDRAKTIARTEAAKADVQGNIAGWKESGLVGGKRWLAAPDCCDLCQELDGTVVGIDDEFDEGDPPLHPNCRCDVTPVLTDDMP